MTHTSIVPFSPLPSAENILPFFELKRGTFAVQPEPASELWLDPGLPPALRALLASDGTVSRFLEAYFWEPLEMEVAFHGLHRLELDQPDLGLISGETVLARRIVLRGKTTHRLYADCSSQLHLGVIDQKIVAEINEARLGIGDVLQRHQLEHRRELLRCGRRSGREPVAGLEKDGEWATRTYRIWIHQRPAILIADAYLIHSFLNTENL